MMLFVATQSDAPQRVLDVDVLRLHELPLVGGRAMRRYGVNALACIHRFAGKRLNLVVDSTELRLRVIGTALQVHGVLEGDVLHTLVRVRCTVCDRLLCGDVDLDHTVCFDAKTDGLAELVLE